MQQPEPSGAQNSIRVFHVGWQGHKDLSRLSRHALAGSWNWKPRACPSASIVREGESDGHVYSHPCIGGQFSQRLKGASFPQCSFLGCVHCWLQRVLGVLWGPGVPKLLCICTREGEECREHVSSGRLREQSWIRGLDTRLPRRKSGPQPTGGLIRPSPQPPIPGQPLTGLQHPRWGVGAPGTSLLPPLLQTASHRRVTELTGGGP